MSDSSDSSDNLSWGFDQLDMSSSQLKRVRGKGKTPVAQTSRARSSTALESCVRPATSHVRFSDAHGVRNSLDD